MQHPNIIKCVDYFETDTDVFILLEYAENGDLFEFIWKK